MKKKLNEDLIIHCMEGVALVIAIALVTYMVSKSDQKKKEEVHFRYHVGVSERQTSF
jgi:predicted protein tyrosine phosphatase